MAKEENTGDSMSENKFQHKMAPLDHKEVDHSSDERNETETKWYRRQDVLALLGGLVFILTLIGAMFGLGEWKSWYAPSGHYHNTSLTSSIRFLPEPPDALQAGAWYYWKNKPEDTNAMTRLFVWVCYLTHQFSMWTVIYLAQAEKILQKGEKYQDRMNKYGWIGFGITIFFHLLHLAQTHTTYDALAKDVTITSSQCSVIMLLIIVLVMEYTERGFMLGWPTLKHTNKVSQKLRLNPQPSYMLRKYHGYAVAWAAIYTFWYHPMENTYGHALGFFYTFIFMLQGSLIYTKLHLNPWWRLLQEFWLVLHGGLVAVQTGTGNSLWPMFTFGFLLMFSFTWIYILPFWEKIPFWIRVFPPLVFLTVVLSVYPFIPNDRGETWGRMTELFSIPATFYLVFFVPWLTLYIIHLIQNKIKKSRPNQPDQNPSALIRTFSLIAFVFIYGFNVALSIILEIVKIDMPSFVSLIILCVVFTFTVPLSVLAIDVSLPKRSLLVKNDHVEGKTNNAFDNDIVELKKKSDI